MLHYEGIPEVVKSKSALTPDSFILPGQQPLKPKTESATALVYKLHGSVDWLRTGDTFAKQDAWGILENKGVPFLATPGPTKKEYVSVVEKTLWVPAMQAIKEATKIIFLGYRFPPSDSEAGRRILGALKGRLNPEISQVRMHSAGFARNPRATFPGGCALAQIDLTGLATLARQEQPAPASPVSTVRASPRHPANGAPTPFALTGSRTCADHASPAEE